MGHCRWHPGKEHRYLPSDQILHHRSRALVRYVNYVDLRADLEQLAGEVLHAPVAGRSVRELAGPGLRHYDQLLHRLHRQRGMHDENQRRHRGKRYRRQILVYVVR